MSNFNFDTFGDWIKRLKRFSAIKWWWIARNGAESKWDSDFALAEHHLQAGWWSWLGSPWFLWLSSQAQGHQTQQMWGCLKSGTPKSMKILCFIMMFPRWTCIFYEGQKTTEICDNLPWQRQECKVADPEHPTESHYVNLSGVSRASRPRLVGLELMALRVNPKWGLW